MAGGNSIHRRRTRYGVRCVVAGATRCGTRASSSSEAAGIGGRLRCVKTGSQTGRAVGVSDKHGLCTGGEAARFANKSSVQGGFPRFSPRGHCTYSRLFASLPARRLLPCTHAHFQDPSRLQPICIYEQMMHACTDVEAVSFEAPVHTCGERYEKVCFVNWFSVSNHYTRRAFTRHQPCGTIDDASFQWHSRRCLFSMS